MDNTEYPFVYIVLLVIVTLAVLYLIERRIRRNNMRRRVFHNLDSAYHSGHFLPGEQLDGAPAEDIAYDMTCYASDFESMEPEKLVPFVKEWMQQKGL